MLTAILMKKTKLPIQFVTGFTGSSLASGVTSVTFSGHQVGDFLLALGGSQQSTDPTFTAGWTRISSFGAVGGNNRVGLIVYKYATTTANETITFTGTGTSAVTYSAGYNFRNVSGIGNHAEITGLGSSGTTITVPELTLNQIGNSSALVACIYTPVITANSGGFTVANGMVYKLNASSPSPSFTVTVPSSIAISGIVELLN